MNQKEAVFKATHAVLKENEVKFIDKTDVKTIVTTELRKQIINLVTSMFVAGEVDFSEDAQAKYNTEEKIRKEYVPGLVSNWFRKDERLNGGVRYQPKNPGSRTGSRDPEIKNLKLLIKSGTLNDDQVAIAEERIQERQQELSAAKAEVSINYDAIPDDLKAVLGIDQ